MNPNRGAALPTPASPPPAATHQPQSTSPAQSVTPAVPVGGFGLTCVTFILSEPFCSSDLLEVPSPSLRMKRTRRSTSPHLRNQTPPRVSPQWLPLSLPLPLLNLLVASLLEVVSLRREVPHPSCLPHNRSPQPQPRPQPQPKVASLTTTFSVPR